MVFDYQVPINIKILCTKQFAAVTLLSAGVSMIHSHHGKDGFRLVRVLPAECMHLDHSVFFVCHIPAPIDLNPNNTPANASAQPSPV